MKKECHMPATPPADMWFNYSSVNDFIHEWMTHKQELAERKIHKWNI